MADNLISVGVYNNSFSKALGIDELDGEVMIYRSIGLSAHMRKAHHADCIPYLPNIADIIAAPDFIGRSPMEPDFSIELVKQYADNVQIGIKLDRDGNYLYVSTMYIIQESKLQRRLNSGRLIAFK